MPSLKALRNRIASVKATQKITKAMQMVAAAKLRRAQEAAESARPYAERMTNVLANIAAATAGQPGAPALIAGTGKEDTHLLLVATGERGLAGAFNSAIARMARDDARRLLAEGKKVKFFVVGRKGYDILRRQYANLSSTTYLPQREADLLHGGEAGRRPPAGDVQRRRVRRRHALLFALPLRDLAGADGTTHHSRRGAGRRHAPSLGGAIYEYEPDEEEILAELLPRNVAIQIFKAQLENAASFYGAQMSAMDNATRNAGDMIDRLTLFYNRQRQAQITKELIEIISGAEAV